MGKIIDGKAVSAAVREEVASSATELIEKGITPGLAVIIVGDDSASKVYVNNKKKGCQQVGFNSFEFALDESTTQQELNSLVDGLNERSDINGILCQLPLPKHLDDKQVIERIRADKDVDAFHPSNVGRIMIGDYHFLPCTPAGVMELIHSTGVDICGKHAVIVGRSNIVGKPMSMLLLHENATVTIVHSKTVNLAEITKTADILVVAVGVADFIKGDMVKDGAVVIDVGINRLADGKLHGDVDFNSVVEKCAFITPVPGGVGPMTISMLLKNTLTAAKIQNNVK